MTEEAENFKELQDEINSHREIDPVTGRFLPGMSGARYGKRGRLSKGNQDFVDYIIHMGEKGLYPWEALGEMSNDPRLRADLRFKARKALTDTFFKDVSLISMKEKEEATLEDLTEHIKSLLSPEVKQEVVTDEEA